MSVLWGYRSGGTGPAPLKCVDNADGTVTLKVDTELVLDGVSVENVKVGSTAGSTSADKYLKVTDDGTLYITGVVGITGTVKVDDDETQTILNGLTSVVAKESKQDTLIGEVQSNLTGLTSVVAKEAKQDTIINELQNNLTGLTSVVAKEAKQDSLIIEVQNNLTGLTSIVSKESKQDALISEVQSNITGLTSIVAKEEKQNDLINEIQLNNAAEKKSKSIGTSPETITFSQEIRKLEIFNGNTAGILYIDLSGATAAVGDSLPIWSGFQYMIDRKLTSFSAIGSTAIDARIFGHYKA